VNEPNGLNAVNEPNGLNAAIEPNALNERPERRHRGVKTDPSLDPPKGETREAVSVVLQGEALPMGSSIGMMSTTRPHCS